MNSEKLEQVWSEVCGQVKSYNNIDPSQINAFFSRLHPQAMSDGFLMITADNDFIKTWIERHYIEFIKRALNDLYHMPFTVIIEVDITAAEPPAPAPAPPAAQAAPAATMATAAETPAPVSSPQPAAAPAANAASSPQIDAGRPEAHRGAAGEEVAGVGAKREIALDGPDSPASTLTFENFVIGESNRMAYSMAVEVAESPGRLPLNPLFIYGKSGLGKTHLMRAIQNYIEETRPSMRTVYVDAQDFVSKYSEAGAIKDQEKVSFRNFRAYYEQADILLLDDVQHLQGKKESMNMLFQLFNTLTSQGKQVVLSADRAPKNIQFDERLKSRFYSGGTIDIQPPEVETKLGIVKSFTDEFSRSEGLGNFTLSDDIQMYIAENSGSNIRELKGAVNTVIYRMIYCDRSDISIDEVRELLANHFTGGMSRSLTVEDIQREVENFFKVSHSDMVGPKRSQSIVRPRQIAIYLCRQLLDLPYGDIGKKFNRDHSTAIHSATSIEERLKTDRDTQEEIEVLQKIICELD